MTGSDRSRGLVHAVVVEQDDVDSRARVALAVTAMSALSRAGARGVAQMRLGGCRPTVARR